MDWTKSMQQTFKYCRVDPGTWGDVEVIRNVVSCMINRDLSDQTLGYATIDCTEVMDECYIRVYLLATQNGLREDIPLGTFLAQTPAFSFDGKSPKISMDAYTPLSELKMTLPPVGYALMKGENIMEAVSRLCRENMRAPVVAASSDDQLRSDFVADFDDTWISFIEDLMMNAGYSFDLDERGRVLFAPAQDIASLRPVWTYDDGNSSILIS